MKQQFPTNKAPQLIIEQCAGPLTVKAHEPAMIVVSSPQATAVADETGNVLQVTSYGPLSILAPIGTELIVREVTGPTVVKGLHNQVTIEDGKGTINCRNLGTLIIKKLYGSLAAKDIDQAIHIGDVYGDVSLRNSQDITLQQIHGDFVARNVTGSVQVTHSDGDVGLRNVSGDVTVAYCDRDVNLRNVAGQAQISNVKGDIRLRDALPPGEHLLQAQGDIIVRWPTGSAVNVQASGHTIQNHLPLVAWPTPTPKSADDDMQDMKGMKGAEMPEVEVEKVEITFSADEVEALKQEAQTEEAGPTLQEEHGRVYLRGRLGDGDCHLTLDSQADIILRPMSGQATDDDQFGEFGMDFGFLQVFERFGEQMANLGETIAREVTHHVNSNMGNLSQELENELGSKYAEQVATKAERAVERAMRKTEEALKRIQRQSVYASPPPPPRAPQPPAKPAAPQAPTAEKAEKTEETAAAQLKILEMLQNGQLGVEEANTLLKALE